MPFIDLDGWAYREPFAWYEETVEVVEAGDGDTSIDASGPGGMQVPHPFTFVGGTVGNVGYRRDFAGTYPQEEGGLDAAWQRARYGHSGGGIWDADLDDLDGAGIGTATHKGARWYLDADPDPRPGIPPPSVAVDAQSGTGAWSLNAASDLYDEWDNHYFASDFAPDGDPAILAAYEAALEEAPPGWSIFLESPWPIFLGFEFACDEVDPGDAIYGGLTPSGTVYVGYRASGLGLSDMDEGGIPTWDGPGAYSTPYATSYSGGPGAWITPPEDCLPTQDPSTGRLLNAPTPFLVLNTYIDFQSTADGEFITPNTATTAPGGFDIHLGDERSELRFAAKTLWRAPLMRFGREGPLETPPRRILGRPHAARVPWGGSSTYQQGNRALGGIL